VRKQKTPLVDRARRDEEGRVRLRVSAPYIRGGGRLLRVFVLVGNSERVASVTQQKMENFHDRDTLARTLQALCDVWAMQNGVDYVLENPERLVSIRVAPVQRKKELSK
jgi:hypothetical protein